MNFISRLLSAISIATVHKNFQGFIPGHKELNEEEWANLTDLFEKPDKKYIKQYEHAFQSVIGDGECLSFASGRMAFYALLKHLQIREGDDVILTGFTCSVMVNAVIRAGANVVYCDIDRNTFGTSAASVRECITEKTRMIIAQHSFGIPCNIVELSLIAAESEIFLLEDCAIALGSTVNGTAIGNFGDAAIFSTDHSKPINTFTGGLLYSTNQKLILKIRQESKNIPDLPAEKLQAIMKRIVFESKYCNSCNYHKLPLLEVIGSLVRKLKNKTVVSPYLDEDQNLGISKTYPYPANLPSFLAYLGLLQLQQWSFVAKKRKEKLDRFIILATAHKMDKFLPAAYFSEDIKIIPLRIVWSVQSGKSFRKKISNFVDTGQIWFLSPIISTNSTLSQFGYLLGTCTNAEEICQGMINLPLTLSDSTTELIIKKQVLEGDTSKQNE